MSEGTAFPSVTFRSQLEAYPIVLKEFDHLCGQIEGFLRAAGFNADGVFDNVTTNQITIIDGGTIVNGPPTTPGSDGGGTGSVPGPGQTNGGPFIIHAAGENTNVQYNDNGSLGGDENFTWDKKQKLLTLNGEDAQDNAQLQLTGDGGSGASIVAYTEEDVELILGAQWEGGDYIARSTNPTIIFSGADGLSIRQYRGETPASPMTLASFKEILFESASDDILFGTENGEATAIIHARSLSLPGSDGADTFECNINISDSITGGIGLQIEMGDTSRVVHFDASGFMKWT